VRVVTTGGGGWGDPLEREPALVLADMVEGRVSAARARDDYGVLLVDAGDTDGLAVDEPGTAQLRAALKAKRTVPPPMIDRGAGFEKMLRGEFAPRMR
jgi:N-methylhydantoinase B